MLVTLFSTLALLPTNAESSESKLIASDGADYDTFGESVEINGDLAIIGSPGHQDYSGAAYIFRRNGNVWQEEAKLLANDGSAYDYFGTAVSISGDLAVVGQSGMMIWAFALVQLICLGGMARDGSKRLNCWLVMSLSLA
jgi:hypothetical protein